jgi:hypothetical protein
VVDLGNYNRNGYDGALARRGGSGVVSMTVLLVLVICIVILSLKYGTKNITTSDTAVLILALSSIVIWWQLNNPVLAVFMATLIDGLGYIPTYRKSWKFPWEETLGFWAAMVIIYILILASLKDYNFLTVPYVLVVVVANIFLVSILFFRRKILKNKKQISN